MGLIQSVDVRHYRSAYDITDVALDPEVTVLVGPNGAGKSNFLRGLSIFSPSEDIQEDDFSVYDESLISKANSQIPITTFHLDPEHDRLGTLQVLHERPSYKSVVVDQNELRTIDGGFETLSDAISTGKNLEITVFADGTYRVKTNSRQDDLPTVVASRKSDLLTVGREIVNQVESIGFANLIPETKEFDSVDITTILNSIEEELSETDKTDPELNDEEDEGEQFLEDIYQDLHTVSGQLGDVEILLQNIEEELPTIAYFDTIQALTDGIPLSEIPDHQAWRAFLQWGGLTSEGLQSVDQRRLESICDEAEDELTRFLNSYVDLEEPVKQQVTNAVTDPLRGRFSVTSQLESETLSIEIEDTEEGTTVRLAQKSTGFRWLVACILTVFAGRDGSRDFDLFVVDDIGVHLHPDWKIKLRHSLQEIATDAQIVYSTHSPFLIENNALDRIRIISHDSSPGSQIRTVAEVRGSEYVHDLLEPIRSSLGARAAEFLYGGDAIAVVEGETDKEYLERFSELFESEAEYPSLDKSIEIMIAKGSNQNVLANFLEVEQPNFVVLIDKDKSGDDQKDKILDNGVSEAKILQLNELPTQSDDSKAEIEDIFPIKMICEGVAQQYPSPVTAQELENKATTLSDLELLSGIGCRLDQYEGQGDISDRGEISKEQLMDYVLNQINESWLTATDGRENSVEDFKWLITELNSRLA